MRANTAILPRAHARARSHARACAYSHALFSTHARVPPRAVAHALLQIPAMVEGREQEMWDYRICLGFAYRVMSWVRHVLLESDDAKAGASSRVSGRAPDASQTWLIRFEGNDATRLTLQIDHARKPHQIFKQKHLYEALKLQESDGVVASASASR